MTTRALLAGQRYYEDLNRRLPGYLKVVRSREGGPTVTFYCRNCRAYTVMDAPQETDVELMVFEFRVVRHRCRL